MLYLKDYVQRGNYSGEENDLREYLFWYLSAQPWQKVFLTPSCNFSETILVPLTLSNFISNLSDISDFNISALNLSANPTKWSNTQTIRWQEPANCQRIVWICLTILWGWCLKSYVVMFFQPLDNGMKNNETSFSYN